MNSRERFEAWLRTQEFRPTAWDTWQAAEAQAVRRCAETIQRYLDHHSAACAHYTPKDHPAFSYHLTRVAIADDIKQAIRAELPEAFHE